MRNGLIQRPARRHLRLALTVSTALAGGFVASGVAGAQTVTLPNPALAVPTVAPGALAPAISPIVGNTLNIGLNAASTVITWNGGFNIPGGGTVNFADTRLVGNGTPAAVLNRDLSGGASQLLGQLTSAKNIAVWVYNPNGIVVGSSAVINTGSLVLSTLSVDNTEFLSGLAGSGTPASASFHLTGGPGAKGIAVQAGASITVTSGNRGLVLVAPQVVANGRFDASGAGGNTPQDVAFVIASDVTINYAAGSPLSITLNKGTVLADAASHLVRSSVSGSVTGQNALFAIASQGSVNDALLQVNASVTTASASGRGIVLSAGMPALPVSGVTTNGSAADLGGTAGLVVAGELSSARNVNVAASGLASVTGAVTAAGDYSVAGGSVALGGAAPTTQSANGAVGIVATGGPITGTSGLTLRSGAAASGTGDLSLSTAGTSGGDISFAPGSQLLAGGNRQATLSVRVGSNTDTVSLGDVAASSLTSAIGSAAVVGGLLFSTPLTIGAVDVRGPLSLAANGISAGTLRADQSVLLISGAGLSATSITSAGGSVSLGGAGTGTSVAGTVQASGGLLSLRGGATTFGAINVGGDVSIGSASTPAGSLVVAGGLTGRTISVNTAGQQAYGGAITAAGSLAATAGGALTAASASAAGDLAFTGASVTVPLANSSGGAVRLTANAGDVRVDQLSAPGDVMVDASGTAAITGTVAAGGAYRIAAGGVTLGSPTFGVTQAAAGGVFISAGAGGITGLPHLLLLANTDGVWAEPLALTVTDASGAISFDPSSTLSGGRGQQSDVVIRTASAGSPLTLGAVTARGLLGATGYDPLATGLTRTAPITLGTVSLAGPLALQAAGIGAGSLTSGTSVALGGTGAIGAASISAAGPIQLTGTGDLTIAGALRTTGSGGDIAVDRLGAVTTGGFVTTGNLTLGATIAPTALTVSGPSTIGGTLAATTTGGQSWQAINASAVRLTAAALALDRVTASAGDVALTALSGDLSTANVSAPGAVSLNARGALVAGALTGGSVTLGATGTLTVGVTTATGTDVTVSGGTVTLAGLTAARDATLTAATGGLAFGSAVTAGRTLSASAPGDVLFNGGTVGGLFRVDSGGVAALGGTVSASSLQLTGASVALGAGARISSAGKVDLDATVGGISGGSGLALAVTSNDPTQFVRLQATGAAGVAFASDSSISAPASRVAVFTADPAARLTLGAVNARALVGLTTRDGDPATQAGALTAAAPVLGALTLTDGFAARATAGDLSIGSLAVAGAGQAITLAAPGALRIGSSVSADGGVSLVSGAPLFLTSVTSGSGQVLVTSGGALSVGALSGATAVSASGTSLSIGTIAGGAATLTSTAGALQLSGGTASAATLRSTGGDVSVTGALTLTGALSISSGGDANLAAAVRAGTASVAGNTVRAADLGATGALTVTARAGDVSSLTAGSAATLAAGGDLTVAATGNAALANPTAARGTLSVNAGTLSVNGASAGVDLRLIVTGAAQVIGPVIAGGGYAVSGRTVTLNGAQSAGGSVSMVATGGALTGLGGLVLTSDALGTGSGPLTLAATGGAIALDPASVLNGGLARRSSVAATAGPNAITLGAVNARALVVNGGVRSDGAISTGALSVTDPLTLLGGAGGLHTGAVAVAAGGATLDAGSGVLSTGAVSASGAAALTGARIDYASLTAAGVTVTAGALGLGGGVITAAGPITLNSVGTLDVAGVTAGGAGGNVAVTAGNTLRLGVVTASGIADIATVGATAADVVLTGGATAGGDVRVASTANIRSPFLTSTSGKLALAAPNGSLSGVNPGDAITLSAGAGGGVSATVGGDLRLGALTGGPVVLAARSISALSVAVGGDPVDLAATGGDLAIAGAVTGGTVSLGATGATTVGGAVTASGAVQLRGGRALTLGDVTGGAVSLTSGGAISGGRATGTTVAVTGTAVGLAGVFAAGGATLTASAGDLTLGTATTGGDLALSATGRVMLPGAVTAGGAYLVRGGTVALGASGVVQAARGRVDITSTTGDITGASGMTLTSDSGGASSAGTLVLDSAGAIAFGGTLVQAGPGGGAALGVNAGSGQAVTLGRVEAASVGGIDTAHGDFSQPFVHAGGISLGDVTTGRVAITQTAGDLQLGKVTASGAVTLATTGALTTGAIGAGSVDLSAGSALTAGDVVAAGSAKLAGGDVMLASLASGGDLAVTAGGVLSTGAVSGRGAATLAAATVQVDSASASTLAITATGDLTGRAGGRAALASSGGDTTVQAGGQARLASLSSAGAASVNAGGVDVAGQLSAARALLVKARQALTVGGATSAGGDATLSAGDTATLDAVSAGGALSVSGSGVAVRSATAGGALTLTSTAELTLGQGQAGGAAVVDAGGLATLGQLVAGSPLTILASDAELIGTQRAPTVTITNRAPATRVLRLGDGTGSDGFRLSNTELGRIDATTLTLDGGAGAVELGTAAFSATAGSQAVRVFSTGHVSVDGAVTATGTGRSFTIGGSAVAPDAMATGIDVVATSDAGGRLLLAGNDVELRGGRIAAGLAAGFIDALAGGGTATASNLVNNGGSSLYNANFGGGFYSGSGGPLLSARSVTVRYTDYALFQNTGLPGSTAGAVLGGTMASPATPALTLLPTASGGHDIFALFGTLNGVGQTAAALLGPNVLAIGVANRAATRINGCLVGSGGGCLMTISIQPTLQVLRVTASDVFGAAQDLTVPFDPVIGGGNEVMLTGPDLAGSDNMRLTAPAESPVTRAQP